MDRFHVGNNHRYSAAKTVSLILTAAALLVLDFPAAAAANPVVELSSIEEVVSMAGYGEEKLSTVLIDGTVLCHPCRRHHSHQHPPPPPPSRRVSGASVGIFCAKSRVKRQLWARNTTDEYGRFLVDLPSHLHSIPNIHRICFIQILHLPRDSICHRSFTGKHKSIKLAGIRHGDGSVRTYTAGNVHITAAAKSCRRTRYGDTYKGEVRIRDSRVEPSKRTFYSSSS